MADEAYIVALQRVIGELHGCPSQHMGTVNVQETMAARIIWQGDVEVFLLVGHPRAVTCYAWLRKDTARRRRFFAVLGTAIVKTPLDAVKFAHMLSTGPLIDEFCKLVEGPR